ncbi:right-handed parallel beta-helix repeat-containing protein [bacterium]|nr:right-handed parallel beta-helix repeat-containing protein [bacterium]
MIRAWNPTKTRNIITIMAAMFAIVASLLTPLCAYGYGLAPIFLNMDNATYNDVRAEAEYQTDALNKPRYSNVPVTINPPEHQTFEGDFTPSSPNGSLMAIFSDDGCNVYVTPSGGTEQLVLNKIDQGQALPNLDEYTPPSLIRLPSSIVSNQPVYEWSAGVTYHIKIEYSNILYTGSLDIDGCTLFAYTGGGSIGDDTTAPSGTIRINSDDDFTTSTSVTLTPFSMDTGTGVYMMRFSNDGSSWSAWENYATTINNWQLTSGDGEKTVYAQYKDRAGNVSSSCFDVIILRASPGSKTIHVNAATGSDTNDGFSWSTAKATITAGVGAAVIGEQVWVAAGTYNKGTLKSGVELYGGFDTAEVNFSDRDWKTNQTIINGGTNGCTVSIATGTPPHSVIDGFIMQNCSLAVWHGSLTISNNKISNPSNMRGIYCFGATLTVFGNTVSGGPYGLNCYSSDIEVFNNIISDTSYGILLQSGTSAIITNNTIVNTITYGIGNSSSYSPTICNNTITSSSNGAYGVYNYNGSSIPTLDHNDVYNPNGTSYYNCTSSSDIHQNPLFEDSSNGNYCLQYDSPCIDAGIDESSILTTDLDGHTRPLDGNLNGTAEFDIGAYEFMQPSVPTITITTPPAIVHKADATTATIHIAGTASDAGSGINHVEVVVVPSGQNPPTSHPWNSIIVTGTENWQCDWSCSQSGDYTIWAYVVNNAGSYAQTSQNLTVAFVGVVYVKPGGSGSGTSWNDAIGSVQSGINTASSQSKEVWVAAGTYYESINITNNVALYGGFFGSETVREQRNWSANTTTLDGLNSLGVMTISNVVGCIVDGFTICNGKTVMGWGSGSGISCYSATATIANNIICKNNATFGGGLYSSSSTLTVVGNVFVGNSAISGGGIYYTNTSGSIANNTIIDNEVSDNGGGIYLESGSPALSNNIVGFNIGGGICKYSGTPTFTKNDVYGNTSYAYSWKIWSQNDTEIGLDLNPAISDPMITNVGLGDWHIASTSACHDPVGTTLAVSMDKDIDSESRVYGSTVDIGADEWNGTDPTSILIEYPTRWKAVGAGFSSPLVADLIPGDNGVKEIAVISNKQWDGSSWFDDGKIYVWKADGTEFTSIMRNGKCLIAQFQSGDAGFPICSRDYLNDDHENTLSTADIDGLSSVDNAHLELIAPTNSDYSGNTIHSFGYDADASVFKPIAGWPVTADYNFWGVAAAIGDANLDGTLEVVAGDESCYVFSWNPAGGPYLWRQLTGTEASSIWFSSVALGDVNYFADTNRFPDAVVGSQHDSPLFAFCGDSWGDTDTYPSGSTWPKETDSAIMSSPAIGLIDSDSDNDIAVCTYGGRLYMWLSSTQTWTYYQLASSTGEKSSPVITELNSQRCVVVGCNNNRVYAVKSDGTPITGWPFEGISLSWTAGSKVVASPAIADVMNTGSPQIVVACADGRVYALWADGYNHANGPIAKVWVCKQSGSAGVKIESTPAICSLDGTQVSMIIGSTDGIYKTNLYSLPSGQTFVPNSARWPWPTFHRDNARTGCQTTDTNPAPPVSASIYGKITSSNGNPVQGAKVYVRVSSGLELPAVYGRPGETRADPVLSAGDAATLNDEFDEGQYCLSQLPPNQTYKITVTDANGGHITTTDVSVTTGKTDQDIQLVP